METAAEEGISPAAAAALIRAPESAVPSKRSRCSVLGEEEGEEGCDADADCKWRESEHTCYTRRQRKSATPRRYPAHVSPCRGKSRGNCPPGCQWSTFNGCRLPRGVRSNPEKFAAFVGAHPELAPELYAPRGPSPARKSPAAARRKSPARKSPAAARRKSPAIARKSPAVARPSPVAAPRKAPRKRPASPVAPPRKRPATPPPAARRTSRPTAGKRRTPYHIRVKGGGGGGYQLGAESYYGDQDTGGFSGEEEDDDEGRDDLQEGFALWSAPRSNVPQSFYRGFK